MTKSIPVYQIDSSVPIPNKRAAWGSLPIDSLKVGDSFLFPRQYRSYVQSTASRLKRKSGKEFTVKAMDEDSCRIWRTK